MAINLKSILGKLFVNDKQIVTLGDTAENGSIESGTNAEGAWVKYPDGTMICTHNFIKNVAVDQTSGNIYRSAIVNGWNFPQVFTTIYSCNISIARQPNGFMWVADGFGNLNTTTMPNYSFMSGLSRVASDIVVQYIAIGRWK